MEKGHVMPRFKEHPAGLQVSHTRSGEGKGGLRPRAGRADFPLNTDKGNDFGRPRAYPFPSQQRLTIGPSRAQLAALCKMPCNFDVHRMQNSPSIGLWVVILTQWQLSQRFK